MLHIHTNFYHYLIQKQELDKVAGRAGGEELE